MYYFHFSTEVQSSSLQERGGYDYFQVGAVKTPYTEMGSSPTATIERSKLVGTFDSCPKLGVEIVDQHRWRQHEQGHAEMPVILYPRTAVALALLLPKAILPGIGAGMRITDD